MTVAEMIRQLPPDDVLPTALETFPEDSPEVRQAQAWYAALMHCCGRRRPIREENLWRAKKLLITPQRRLDYDRPIDVAARSREGLYEVIWTFVDPYDVVRF